MKLILATMAVTVLAAWLPGGLIHQGQRLENPRAGSIAAQLLNRCDPTTPEWRGCK